MNVCTIVAKNYLAHARVLAQSLREQHPDSELTVLVLDDLEGYVDPAQEPYRLWGPKDLDCEPFEQMVSAYSVIELSTAVKPWLLRKLLTEQDHAVYLDPDIRVVSPLDEIRELAIEHGIVLTPHNLTPIPRDGRYPSEESILIAGAYNLGFIGLGQSEAATGLLDWWSERLETDCVVDPASGRFVDQKWIDLVPGIWPETHLLRDPAYNIAYWNLHARTLEVNGDARHPRIDGRPVRFLHFSGYNPDRPDELSKHQDRIRFSERPDVKAVCDLYGEALREQGFAETTTWPYSLARREAGHSGSASGVDGVNVVGYLNAELGVGEVARQAIGALDAAGIPVVPVGVAAGVGREEHDFEHASHAHGPFGANLICVNADMLPTVAGQLGPEFFEDRRTIGWWWWESDALPEQWHGSFDLVDEVWAGSRFVAETLAKVSPVPVAHIPTPVTMRPGVAPDRAAVGLPDGFVFLFAFDYNSVVARKNPTGVIEAYRRAFPEPRDGVSLVIKSINGERHPAAVAELQAAAGGRADILLRDEFLNPELRDVLVASCDCYVSLHRSEGFGFTLAEAMLLGKPVVGTGYSGSGDYLSDDTGFVVRHDLVEIGEGAAPYPADGRWAEPDLDHAAELLRRVVDHPDEAAARAARGRTFILEHHSAAAAGRAMSQRLARLAPSADAAVLDPPMFNEAQEARTETLHAIEAPVAPPVSSLGSLLQRLTRRLLRRSAERQESINHALWWSIESQAAATLQAFENHSQRLGQLEAHATATRLADGRRSAELRMLGNELGAVRRHLTDVASDLHPAVDLVHAAAAEPYMDGTPFTRFEADDVGRVMGFHDDGRDAAGDAGYHAFEDVFRGSEAMIRERQQRYLPLLADHGPVLDAGCGRGEFLDLLRDASIEARGVDLNPELVAYCQSKGHDVVEADAVTVLTGLDAGSLGAIVSMQVVEHVPEDDLRRMLIAAHRALAPGGRLILETVNPHSAWALKAFWVDLSHQHPIFPEVLLQLCRQAGFGEGYAFAPYGQGDWDADRTHSGEYAVVMTR
ncbi:methyltransferase domain-containing protein [Baekduia sp.]|uniref:methyltransferase domain-containing protein n=1 Tax=Baekduia sp. TaxID=2600305 RepID=UPI002E072E88|nr:methyltransferase domain-containing protein [Baekduia sp.]